MSNQGINVNDYLDKLKPKLLKYKTNQEIFDHVIRTLVHQRVPCVRIEDISREVNSVCFNSSAYVSPLLSFFSRDDLSCLKKVIGYEPLQNLVSADIRAVILGPLASETSAVHEDYQCMSETEKENAAKIIEMLGFRGLDEVGIQLLCKLENAHRRWFSDLKEEDFESQTKYRLDPVCMFELHKTFCRVAYQNSLNEEVLKFVRP
jgi:hypothetical protein